MRNKVLFAVSLALLLNTSKTLGVDFGVHGNSYLIKEEDARETFIKSAARVDWEKPRKQIRESIVELKKNDKNERGLYPPNEDMITFIDPSVTAQRDVYAPYVKDGQVKKELIIAKGTKVNPLDYMQPSMQRLFVNANDPNQVQFVRDMVENYNVSMQIIVVQGKLETIKEIIGVGVYQATPSVLDKNQIDFTPSLITVSRHPDFPKHLQVTSLSRPFDTNRLQGLISYE
jgi:conjugal transfer pilus assembly protein TraW